MNGYEKMRNALTRAIGDCADCNKDCHDCLSPKATWMPEAKEAITTPCRNCDIGTAEERAKRYHKFCHDRMCETCPALTSENDDSEDGSCIIQWEDMPYESEVSDGSK